MNDEFYKLLEAKGHKLKRREDGSVDFFALDAGNHNGPGCVICEETWCEHCWARKDEEVEECEGPPKPSFTDRDRLDILKSLIIGRKRVDFPLPNIDEKYITEENLENAMRKIWESRQNLS